MQPLMQVRFCIVPLALFAMERSRLIAYQLPAAVEVPQLLAGVPVDTAGKNVHT